MTEGIHIMVASDVLREFYDARAKDAEREATISEAVLAAYVKEAGANSALVLQVTQMIGDTRTAQAMARAAVWRFLRDNTPIGARVAVRPQELLDLGVRIAKGAGA
jgi:ribosomal protein L5